MILQVTCQIRFAMTKSIPRPASVHTKAKAASSSPHKHGREAKQDAKAKMEPSPVDVAKSEGRSADWYHRNYRELKDSLESCTVEIATWKDVVNGVAFGYQAVFEFLALLLDPWGICVAKYCFMRPRYGSGALAFYAKEALEWLTTADLTSLEVKFQRRYPQFSLGVGGPFVPPSFVELMMSCIQSCSPALSPADAQAVGGTLQDLIEQIQNDGEREGKSYTKSEVRTLLLGHLVSFAAEDALGEPQAPFMVTFECTAS